MSRRCFVGILTGVLAVVAAVVVAPAWTGWLYFDTYKLENTHKAQDYRTQKERAVEGIRKVCLDRVIGSTIQAAECIANSEEAEASAKATEYDLRAQQDMALWALGVLLVSVASTGVSLVGVFLLIISLSQTRRAIKDTRELGEAEVRAYVTCTECQISNVATGYAPKASIKLRNSGQTPAANVRTKIALDIANWPDRNGVHILAWEVDDTRGLSAGGVDGVETEAKRHLTRDDIQAIQDGKIAIFAIVEISYVDVFGAQNNVKQRFVFTSDHFMRGTSKADVASYGNSFRWGRKKEAWQH